MSNCIIEAIPRPCDAWFRSSPKWKPGPGALTPIVLGSEIDPKCRKRPKAETYRVGIVQRDDRGEVTGAARLEVRAGSGKNLGAHAR
jgi:hypothetical protein